MKVIFNISFVASFFILLLNSCGPPQCYIFTYINSSDHTISLIRYRENRIVAQRSFFSLPPNDRHGPLPGGCGEGFFGPPFMDGYTTIGDSVVVVFNDTLRVLFILELFSDGPFTAFGDRCPSLMESWTLVQTRGDFLYYEYEFTNWHFVNVKFDEELKRGMNKIK